MYLYIWRFKFLMLLTLFLKENIHLHLYFVNLTQVCTIILICYVARRRRAKCLTSCYFVNDFLNMVATDAETTVAYPRLLGYRGITWTRFTQSKKNLCTNVIVMLYCAGYTGVQRHSLCLFSPYWYTRRQFTCVWRYSLQCSQLTDNYQVIGTDDY